MTKRRCLLAGLGLLLLGLLLIFAIRPWRYAVFALFQGDSGPPSGRTGPSGWGGLGPSPSADDLVGKDRLVPGIDYCCFAAGSYSGGPVPHADFTYFIWGDFHGGAGGTNTVGKDGFKFHGNLWNQQGNRRVEYAGATKDGKAGRITVEGKEYDLSEGTLFLVSAGSEYRVKQLKRELIRYRDADELFKDLSKQDREVLDFFGAAAVPK